MFRSFLAKRPGWWLRMRPPAAAGLSQRQCSLRSQPLPALHHGRCGPVRFVARSLRGVPLARDPSAFAPFGTRSPLFHSFLVKHAGYSTDAAIWISSG